MFSNDSTNNNKGNNCNSAIKTIGFNYTIQYQPVSVKNENKNDTPVKDYESKYKEYLKSVQMNGNCITPVAEKKNEKEIEIKTEIDTETEEPKIKITILNEATDKPSDPVPIITLKQEDVEEEEPPLGMDEGENIEYLEPPKRKRGRPKGSGKFRTVLKPQPRIPATPPKKRGWPLGLSRKTFVKGSTIVATPSPPQLPTEPRRRGRPRKVPLFSFHSIVSDIKTVALPTVFWSANVSVTATKSEVFFTRSFQNADNAVNNKHDRLVKFNGSVDYELSIDGRDAFLVGAPSTVTSIRDVQILLQIINEIKSNDPIIEYLNR